MTLSATPQVRPASPLRVPARDRGFTIMELLIVVAIVIIMSAMAVPLLRSAMNDYQMRAAVSSVTGAIQSTRYRAIASGYPFALVLDNTSNTLKLQSDPNRTGTFADIANTKIPFAGSSAAVALDNNVTLQFNPNGSVQATTGAMTMNLTYRNRTEQISVSNYGSIKVTP